MKTIIECGGARDALAEQGTITTPFGRALLEIQGVLNLPTSTPEESSVHAGNFIRVGDEGTAVKFGRVEFNGDKATMFVGNLQRLLGEVVPLAVPLGVLKVEEGLEIVDVIKYKLIFKDRPLPVM